MALKGPLVVELGALLGEAAAQVSEVALQTLVEPWDRVLDGARAGWVELRGIAWFRFDISIGYGFLSLLHRQSLKQNLHREFPVSTDTSL